MISVCKHCQKQYFSHTPGYCCPDCKDIDKMRFELIKAYLKRFPNSNAMQIADALDLKTYTVLKYVDEGMLVIGKGEFEQI